MRRQSSPVDRTPIVPTASGLSQNLLVQHVNDCGLPVPFRIALRGANQAFWQRCANEAQKAGKRACTRTVHSEHQQAYAFCGFGQRNFCCGLDIAVQGRFLRKGMGFLIKRTPEFQPMNNRYQAL